MPAPLAALLELVVALVVFELTKLVLVVALDTVDVELDTPPAPFVQVGTTAGPVGVSLIPSSALTHPLLAVKAAGHATWVNVTPGLFAFWNQSKRQ